MSEFRRDRMTGDWVIVAPERTRRPQRPSSKLADRKTTPRFDASCPFCPGNETLLPGITVEHPKADSPGWQVRVVPNKFPAVGSKPSGGADASTGDARAGLGVHEVIIDSSRHDADLASMPVGEIETAFSVYRSRFSTLLDRPDIEAIVLFRNHGSASGASLVHPHAQLVGLSVVPPWLEARERWARERYEGGFKCVTCAELDLERHDSSRLIEETEQFVASVPFAATVPSEIMIIPKRHCGSFAELSHTETLGLAALLRRTLRRLNSVHGDPPYNLFVDPALRDGLRQSHSHWRLRIVPDLAKWGGFERATHMPINPSCPEEDAARLREAIVKAEATP